MPATVNQEVSNSGLGLGSTITVSISNTQGGATLALWALCDNTKTLSSVTDTQGNSYTISTSVNATSNSKLITFAYARNIVGGASANTVTATWSGSSGNAFILVGELRGVSSNPYDTGAGAYQTPGTGANAITTGNMTPNNQPALIYAMAASLGNTSLTAGTGFTSLSAASGLLSNSLSYRTESLRITSTSAVAATATQATAFRTVIIAGIFDEASTPISTGMKIRRKRYTHYTITYPR